MQVLEEVDVHLLTLNEYIKFLTKQVFMYICLDA